MFFDLLTASSHYYIQQHTQQQPATTATF